MQSGRFIIVHLKAVNGVIIAELVVSDNRKTLSAFTLTGVFSTRRAGIPHPAPVIVLVVVLIQICERLKQNCLHIVIHFPEWAVLIG